MSELAKNGAQGRDRTTDTVIFSHVLYQLSYLGTPDPEEGSRRERKRAYRGGQRSLSSPSSPSEATGSPATR